MISKSTVRPHFIGGWVWQKGNQVVISAGEIQFLSFSQQH